MSGTGENPFSADDVAAQVLHDHRARVPFRPLRPDDGVDSLERAYAVQDRFIAGISDNGLRRRAGHKIGLTSKTMQAMCGLDQPIAGTVFADTVKHAPARLDPAAGGHIGLEFEICVQIDAAPDPANGPFDAGSIARHVAAVGPAFEVIDDRHADYDGLDIYSIIAENSWNAGAVLGPMRPFDGDLAALDGVLRLNGAEIDRGAVSEVLGHPFTALAWLVDHLGSRGDRLEHGSIVLTGSIMTTRFPDAGDRYAFSVEGLGEVTADIASGGEG